MDLSQQATTIAHHHTFPFAQPITVVVKGSSGNVQITTANSSQIDIMLRFHSVNALQQLTTTQIQFDEKLQRLEVICSDSPLEMQTPIEISIRAPAITTIHTSTTTGNIIINAPNCTTIHTSTTAGNITIDAPNTIIQYDTAIQSEQKPLQIGLHRFITRIGTLIKQGLASINQYIPKDLPTVQSHLTALHTYPQQFIARISAIAKLIYTTTTSHNTAVDPSLTASSGLNIAYLFSLLVGISTAFVYPLAWYRADLSEDSDKFLVLVALVVIGLSYLLIHYVPDVINRLSTHVGAKIVFVVSIFAFLGVGFREENFYTDFLGFNSAVLLCALGLVFLIPQLQRKTTAKIMRLLGLGLSIYVVVMGIDTILIRPQSLSDVFFIFNELLAPLTQLKLYSTFIPQYVNLFQYFTLLLDFLKVTQYPQLTINLLHVFLGFMSFVTIGIACYMNYKYMYVRSISIAILVTLPMFILTSRPFWDTVAVYQGYYVLPFFTYSLVPIRLFTVFGGGILCLWIIRNATQSMNRMLGMCILCGIIASIGVYNSNDFGIFTWVGISVAIIFQPFQSIKNRLIMSSLFLTGTILGLIGLIVVNNDLNTINTNYLFWFQRNFASGFGGLPILFPGNGLMLVISIFATWFCTLKIFTTLQQKRAHYAQDQLIDSHFATLIYIATVSVVSLPYYTNHSVMSYQGSTFYIFLCISLFLLYQLLKRMQLQSFAIPPRFADVSMRIFIVLPIATALLYTPLYNRISQSMPLNDIITTDKNDLSNAQEYNELSIAGINDRYVKLQPLQLKIAYVGSYANIIELYTHIPAASIFDHPGNVDISPDAAKMYCNQMQQLPYDLYLTNVGYVCENMTIGVSGDFGLGVYYRPDFPQTHPKQWKQLREIAHVCPITAGAVVCPNPYIEMEIWARQP